MLPLGSCTDSTDCGATCKISDIFGDFFKLGRADTRLLWMRLKSQWLGICLGASQRGFLLVLTQLGSPSRSKLKRESSGSFLGSVTAF